MLLETNFLYIFITLSYFYHLNAWVWYLRITRYTDMFGPLIILADSSGEFDQKQAMGTYEFTVKPRSLFAPDSTVVICCNQS